MDEGELPGDLPGRAGAPVADAQDEVDWRSDLEVIAASGRFDADFYLRTYPELAEAGIDPLTHYARYGGLEGRSPNADFDSADHLQRHPELRRSGANPFADFLRRGDGGAPPRAGTRRARRAEPPILTDAELVRASGLFDEAYYLHHYPTLKSVGVDPLEHYLAHGGREGRVSSPVFDNAWYLKQNPEVAASGVNPLVHYLRHGARRGLAPFRPGAFEPRQPVPEPLFGDVTAPAGPIWRGLTYSTAPDRQAVDPVERADGPLISIILPVYNTPERYLREVLRSIRLQTYPRWELCIVNDASGDAEVGRTVRRWAELDSRIRVATHEKNGGIARASQTALEMATGDFIAFVDHDDVLAPTALAEAARVLSEHPEVDFVFSDHAMLGDDGVVQSLALKPGWSPELFLSTNYIVHFKVMRRELVLAVGGFTQESSVVQDIGLTCRMIEGGARIRHLPKVLYYWRTHPASVAVGTGGKPSIEALALQTYNGHLKRRGLPAKMVWPAEFQARRTGVYKLEFEPWAAPVAIVALDREGRANRRVLEAELAKTRSSHPWTLHVAGPEHPVGRASSPSAQRWSGDAFAGLIDSLDAELLVFLSPTTRVISASWLDELTGYLRISDEVGAVVGKVLDVNLSVADGPAVGLSLFEPIAKGMSDAADGNWFNNRIASNVDGGSASLMATRLADYRRLGGMPFVRAPEAGAAYSEAVRRAGQRIVYNPWSKIVDRSAAAWRAGRVRSELPDAHYHPFFSRLRAYEVR